MTGYQGLASHGGTAGLILALLLYVRQFKMPVWQVLDNIAIATPITACFIRLGNLMNSEIVGKVTDVPWAFLFVNGDPAIAGEPRHPGQLYEALAYFCFIFVMLWFYQKSRKDRVGEKKPENRRFEVGTGFYFGLVLTLIFTFRFFIEYTKEIQVEKEADYLLNIGQLLSIPFVIIGVICMFRRKKQ
jgi:prolipoprotein diacylglyceryl transferase